MSRSTWQYHHKPRPRVSDPVPHRARTAPAWLSAGEQEQITEKLTTAFAGGNSVYQGYYDALDAGDPVASLSTWHRIARSRLNSQRPVRRTRKHRASVIPTLVVNAPMQAWSWDITHLKGPYKRVSYQLYVALDVFSRMIVGWRVEAHEDDELAREMFTTAFGEHRGRPGIVHSDGGPAMTSKTLTGLFHDLGIEVSKNRPRVSNDNPYSESLFKTAKYTPTYPTHFTDINHARAWTTTFIDWYNQEHHHTALEGHTPTAIHHGTWKKTHHERRKTMENLHAAHPERFNRPPTIRTPMAYVAINHPTTDERLQTG